MESKNLTTCSTCGMAYSIQKFAIVRTAEEKKSLWEGLPEEMKKTLEIKVNLNKVHKEPEFFFGQSRICNGCNKNFCSAECRFQHFQVCEYKPCVEERRTEKKKKYYENFKDRQFAKECQMGCPDNTCSKCKEVFCDNCGFYCHYCSTSFHKMCKPRYHYLQTKWEPLQSCGECV